MAKNAAKKAKKKVVKKAVIKKGTKKAPLKKAVGTTKATVSKASKTSKGHSSKKKSASKKVASKGTQTKSALQKTHRALGKGQSRVVKSKRSNATQSSVPTIHLGSLFTPLDDRVLILPEVTSDRTPGGIIIPESARQKDKTGKVVAVGRGKRDDKGRVFPLDLRAGDRVLWQDYAGSEVQLLGQTLLVVRESEVLGVLPDKNIRVDG